MYGERIWFRGAKTALVALTLLAAPLPLMLNHAGPVRQIKSTSPAAWRPAAANTGEARLWYAVRAGDTLSALSVRYGVPVLELAQANGLNDPDRLTAGTLLVVPTTPAVPGNPVAAGVTHTLPWPVSGPVSSPFGEREIFGHREFHTGVDIAAPPDTPIRAPLAGRVVFAGPLGTYGLAVVLDHGDGFSTLYAHAARLEVTPGQEVSPGEVLALVGETGEATGPHLHFETRVDGQPRDPELYLAVR